MRQTRISERAAAWGPGFPAGLAAAVWFLAPAAALAFGLGIHPTTVEVGMKPGSLHRQVLTVGNVHKEKTLALTVGLADWTLNESQKLKLFPPGSTPQSASNWIRFSPASLKLRPGESQRIVVEIQVPVQVPGAGDYRTAVLISPVMPPPEERRKSPSGIWNRVQVSSLFYVTLPPAKADSAVTEARVERAGDGTPEVRFSVHNSGNSHARLSGDVRLLDAGGDLKLVQPITQVVLEGRVGKLRARLHEGWKSLPPGSYRVDFDLEAYEGPVPVRLAQPLTLRLPLPAPPLPARRDPSP